MGEEIRKQVLYTIVCIHEFANKHGMTQKEAFQFLTDHQGMAFLYEFYDVEHTLSFADVIEDLETVCARHGGVLA